ncbi:MAG TPA: OmpA family protein [Edaphocola sp.]|nr:OmpA family protein [Edaphocola sp.]
MNTKSLGIVILSTFTLFSCVSNKKYNDATSSLKYAKDKNVSLSEQIANLKQRLELMEKANEEAAAEIEEKETNLNTAKETLEANRLKLSEQDEKLSGQQDRLKKLQAVIDQQKAQSELLKNKMADALKGFNSDQLAVTQKGGKVYVSMQESLLFPSGSAEVNNEGKNALAKLAEVLNANPDIKINVEGHTDSIPIKIKFEDNWALSVARATSIVRILANDYLVNPTRIIASGRSQYFPVATNETKDGRAKNRRTEIILEPNLDAIMDILNTENK